MIDLVASRSQARLPLCHLVTPEVKALGVQGVWTSTWKLLNSADALY